MIRHLPDIPRATVRLQLGSDFDFNAAAGEVPYLARLGVSHLYLSPVTMARPGSPHGYDVIDHNRLNPELGGETGFERLHDAAAAHDMGLILDFVPNHMGIGGAENRYWSDLLEWGRDSTYAHWFDIDWDPAEETLKGKLLVPFLGADYGTTLEKGELRLTFDAEAGGFDIRYYEHRFPVSPKQYAEILSRADEQEPLRRLAARAAPLARKRRMRSTDKASVAELKAELAALAASDGRLHAALDAAAESYAGKPGRPRSFRDLHRLLERQSYRLAYWRTATDEINYRRFFDINDLAGLRVEDDAVFEQLHRLVLALIEGGRMTGLRLDHVDGLYDPAGYVERLQAEAARRLGCEESELPLYLLVEKILAPFERLPEGWAVHGTTGYDFMAQAAGLLVDPNGERPLTRLYTRLTGRPGDFDEVAAGSKRQILRNNLSAEFTVIARRLTRLAKRHWQTRDFTYPAIRAALSDFLTQFPVYRTYLAGGWTDEQGRRFLQWAYARAVREPGLIDESVYRFIRDVLLGEWRPQTGGGRAVTREVEQISGKFQQLSGPVTAKSVEDTAFYRHARLLALNEVGSDPARWGMSPAAFHRGMAERAEHWPYGMLATATHDHKRGEDVRARLAVLSESPREWTRAVTRFFRLNRRRRGKTADEEPAPVPNAEYFFYQTLVGAWPLTLDPEDGAGLAGFAERLETAMLKAVREAKLSTNWAKPNEAYEAAVSQFVLATLDPRRARAFLRAAHDFVESIAPAGAINALSQTVLKYTCPGVPDLYQGTEFWDFSLVDPDNRRPVDFAARAEALARSPSPSDLLSSWRDGHIKQFVIARLLDLRRQEPELFRNGDYVAVGVEGPAADRLLAFERRLNGRRLRIAVPRLVSSATRAAPELGIDPVLWEATALEGDMTGWQDVLTGRKVATEDGIADLLAAFPVCVLLCRP